MIEDMIREWENGAYCVLGIKRSSEEHSLMFWLRKQYYRLVDRLSSTETIQNYTVLASTTARWSSWSAPSTIPTRTFADDCRDRAAYRQTPYDQPPANLGHQEQLVHPVRHWYARHHQQLESPAAAGGPCRFIGASLSFLVAMPISSSNSCFGPPSALALRRC